MKTQFLKIERTAAFVLITWLLAATRCFAQDFAGIGIALNKENGGFVVKQVLPGGPAALSGKIQANDRIVAIAQEDKPAVKTEGLEIGKVIQMIRGPKGTAIHLTLVAGQGENTDPRVVSLVRSEIKNLSAGTTAPGAFEPGKAAPEIEGEDMDGKKFKLSDYRGKAVMLDFWGDW
ncbi:MAG: PDZ domain-containing protein [Verrucomicrobia bacterium]|nr:PDZ domain-containing protein [Verrucomicrobiota bacterium]